MVIQEMVDEASKAKWYYSDAFPIYDNLWGHYGRYEVSEGKTETYSIKGDITEIRHFLARLARSSLLLSLPLCLGLRISLVLLLLQQQAAL
jgi:IS1 family transposase